MKLTAASLSLEGLALEDLNLTAASLSLEGLALEDLKLTASSLSLEASIRRHEANCCLSFFRG